MDGLTIRRHFKFCRDKFSIDDPASPSGYAGTSFWIFDWEEEEMGLPEG